MNKQSEFTSIQLQMLIDMALEYNDKLALELLSIHISNNRYEIDTMIKDVLNEQ